MPPSRQAQKRFSLKTSHTFFGLWLHHQIDQCRAALTGSIGDLRNCRQRFAVVTTVVAAHHAIAVATLIGNIFCLPRNASFQKSIIKLTCQLGV